jgi:hypothetical protein
MVVGAVLLSACGGVKTVDDGSGAGLPPSSSVTTAGPVAVMDSGDPCTIKVDADLGPVPVGVAPQELQDLVLDRSTLGVDGDSWHEDLLLGSYQDNQELVEMQNLGSDGCRVLERSGRITGYTSAWFDFTSEERRIASVDLFSTPQGAKKYVDWMTHFLSTSVVEQHPKATAVTEPVDGLGAAAVMVEVTIGKNESSRVIVRSGLLVGTVSAGGTPEQVDAADLKGLAAAQAARLVEADLSGQPYDAALLLSAPLPKAAFGRAYADFRWDWYFGGCVNKFELVGRSSMPVETRADLARFGWLVSCYGMYEAEGQGSGADGSNRILSSLAVYGDPAMAKDALADGVAGAKRDVRTAKAATTFNVPGPPGAVGMVREVVDGDTTLLDTRVSFVHGSLVAAVAIRDPSGGDHVDEVIALAASLAARLDKVVGAG